MENFGSGILDGKKIRIWDGKILDPGWKKFGSGINTGFKNIKRNVTSRRKQEQHGDKSCNNPPI
jgi:hypothetical protein